MFNVFKKILENKELTDEDVKKVSDFVFCRWLSGTPQTIQIAQMFNLYSKIPLETKLKLTQKLLNKRIKYIPYVKSNKENQDKNIEYLIEFFNISREKAQLYLEFISKEDINYIKDCIDSKYANR